LLAATAAEGGQCGAVRLVEPRLLGSSFMMETVAPKRASEARVAVGPGLNAHDHFPATATSAHSGGSAHGGLQTEGAIVALKAASWHRARKPRMLLGNIDTDRSDLHVDILPDAIRW